MEQGQRAGGIPEGSGLGLSAVARSAEAEVRLARRSAKREGGSEKPGHEAQAGQRSMRGSAADCSAASLIRKPSLG
jgi:hypothetical protein